MALDSRVVSAGLVHHSDRGVQYACDDYTTLLKEKGIREYENLAQARACIKQSLEALYHQKRLHSGVGYMPPVEFEVSLTQSEVA